MKIYISGPITGLEVKQVEKNFEHAICRVSKMFPNADIINPHSLCKDMPFTEWKDFMQICLKMLAECDTIYMMNGWPKSYGCMTEYYFAAGSDKRIIIFDENEDIE